MIVKGLITPCTFNLVAGVVRGYDNTAVRISLLQKPDSSCKQRFSVYLDKMLWYVIIVLLARSLAVSHYNIFHNSSSANPALFLRKS